MTSSKHPLICTWIVAGLAIGCEGADRPASGTDRDRDPPPPEAPAIEQLANEPADRAGSSLRFDFEADEVGQAPRGFASSHSGRGAPGRWQVIEAEDAPSGTRAVAQLSEDATSYRFPLLVLEELAAANVDLSVSGRAIAGVTDQAIGLVWRYRDPDNYYVVRVNALEGNVVSYKMENGRRSDLDLVGAADGYGASAEVPAQTWLRLRVVAVDDLFVVELDGKELFRVRDRTFTEPGKMGLWTKADSVTWFDDLRVTTLDPVAAP